MSNVKRLQTAVAATALFTAAFAISGCDSSGLSPREPVGADDSTRLMQLSEALSPANLGAATESPRPLKLPAKIAVAQMGEVSPAQNMLDVLQNEGKICSVASPVNGNGGGEQMRQYARDLGADYLFVFGGTVDRSTNDTGLAVADLTIIGAFVMPSKQIDAEGKAAGSLVDLQTGRVALSVSADDHERRLSPAASASADEIALLETLRDKLTKQLGERLISQAQAVAIAK